MVEEAPGITRLLDKLEAADYVRRVRAGQDRRQVMCHATDSALDLLARIDPHIDALEAALLGGLETDELTQLLALLARVREGPGRASSVER
jgi:DNA-binding MarR family transcriptional regulator